MGEREGRLKSRNMYKGPMDKDNGSGGVGQWGVMGEKWGQL